MVEVGKLAEIEAICQEFLAAPRQGGWVCGLAGSGGDAAACCCFVQPSCCLHLTCPPTHYAPPPPPLPTAVYTKEVPLADAKAINSLRAVFGEVRRRQHYPDSAVLPLHSS